MVDLELTFSDPRYRDEIVVIATQLASVQPRDDVHRFLISTRYYLAQLIEAPIVRMGRPPRDSGTSTVSSVLRRRRHTISDKINRAYKHNAEPAPHSQDKPVPFNSNSPAVERTRVTARKVQDNGNSR